MGNVNNSKLIRIYGVTLASVDNRVRPYGHGAITMDNERIEYVDYFIEDLVKLIKNQGLEKRIIDKLTKQEKLL